jgi:hypothetical protein
MLNIFNYELDEMRSREWSESKPHLFFIKKGGPGPKEMKATEQLNGGVDSHNIRDQNAI